MKLSILRSARLMLTSLMNKTIIALALSSVYTPLIPVSRTQLGLSLSFAGLKMSKFFSSFIYSNVAYREINIRNSDFGFFLSTVVNLDSADFTIDHADLTETYQGDNGHYGWITCPTLLCQNSVFHDITADGTAAGAIGYQGSTYGKIKFSTFTRIRATIAGGGAGGIVSREYFGTTSGGKTDMEGCCFSDIIAKIKGGNTESSAFSLSGTKGINIKTSLVYNCGDNIASYTAIIASSEGETYVDNFNSSSNRGNGDGLGLTIYTNNNGVNSHSTLQYTNFFDIKSGTVLYATHTDLAGGKGEDLTNYKHTIDLICINFISTSGNDAMISTLNSYGKGASSLPNRVYMVSFEQCVFKQNEYRNKIDINFQYEYPGCLTLNGCKGDKDTFTVDLYNFITITDTMYKKVADPKPNAVFSPVCTYNAPAPPPPKTPTPKPPPPPPPPKTPTSKPVPPPPPPKTPTSKPVTVQPIPPKPATSQSQIDPDDSHQNDDTKGKVMTSGKIAGIVIGVIVGVAVLGVAGLVIYKKVLKKPEDSDMGADGITI